MTTAQIPRLALVRRDAQAAGTTVTDYLTGDGYVVVLDTDGEETVAAAIWRDGSLHL